MSQSPTITDLDGQLLNRIQSSIPLNPTPFATLGKELGIDETTCLKRLNALRHELSVIRQISPIFDTHALGYQSSLVAARVPLEHLEHAASVINEHPGVSHNYQRDHEFNLWYTLAISPDSELGLDHTVAKLHELSRADSTRILPTLKLFKIGVKLNMAKTPTQSNAPKANHFTQADRMTSANTPLTTLDRNMIRVLQQDLPLIPRPFDVLASQANCSVDDLIQACQRYLERKQMRRFSAVLHHRHAGFGANAMGVWQCPEDQLDEMGKRCAAFDEVSHCYHRPAYDDLPYNLYTMVHGKTRDDALEVLKRIQQATGIENYSALWSSREFKKVRVRYFTSDEAAWEAKNAQA
ncbi:MAG: AsnC family transcriptional regulator [Phycisphaeraceae bacterium]|nr:AsnC family transcriptional regulator [Phycisphaeraceae bacterium]